MSARMAAAAILAGTVLSPFIGASPAGAECTYHQVTKIPTSGGLLYIDKRNDPEAGGPAGPPPTYDIFGSEGTWIYAEDTGDTDLQWGNPWLGIDELKAVNAENCKSMNPHDLLVF